MTMIMITQEEFNKMEERIKNHIALSPCNAGVLKGIITHIIDETTIGRLEYGTSWELACELVGKIKSIVQDIFRINIEDSNNDETTDNNIILVLHEYIDKELKSIFASHILIEQD